MLQCYCHSSVSSLFTVLTQCVNCVKFANAHTVVLCSTAINCDQHRSSGSSSRQAVDTWSLTALYLVIHKSVLQCTGLNKLIAGCSNWCNWMQVSTAQSTKSNKSPQESRLESSTTIPITTITCTSEQVLSLHHNALKGAYRVKGLLQYYCIVDVKLSTITFSSNRAIVRVSIALAP